MIKSHKNKLYDKYPPIIHGDARGGGDEFVVHTEYPRFLARRKFDDTFTEGRPLTAPIRGEIGRNNYNQPIYNSNCGIWLSDFIFFDEFPENKEEFIAALLDACNKVSEDTVLLDEETMEKLDMLKQGTPE